jgi:sec-independent protein translocase protein TatA
MFKQLGPTELMIILFIILLLFGAKRMPDMARSLGRSVRILKAETKNDGTKADEQPKNPEA